MAQPRRVELPAGSRIVFQSLKWESEILSITDSGREVAAIPTTHTRTVDGYRTYKPGHFKESGQLSVTFRYDIENPPPVGLEDDILLDIPVVGSTEHVIRGGRGFIMSDSVDYPNVQTGESPIEGSFVIQKSGEWKPIVAEPVVT